MRVSASCVVICQCFGLKAYTMYKLRPVEYDNLHPSCIQPLVQQIGGSQYLAHGVQARRTESKSRARARARVAA